MTMPLPRLGATAALTVTLLTALSAPAFAINVPPRTKDFNFSFSGSVSGGGTIFGSGVLVAKPYGSPGEWLVTNVLNGALDIAGFPLSLTWVAPGAYLNNDNLLFPNLSPQLDNFGISFDVANGAGYLNLSDPPMTYNFSLDLLGATFTGAASFQATPGPAPGTGMAGLGFLILAGAAARARGLLAR